MTALMETVQTAPSTAKTPVAYQRGMPVLHEHAAGIDVASREHWVCLVTATGEEVVRQYGQTTAALQELVAWVVGAGVQSVALESTGVYWIPLYDALELAGLEVWLVDGRSLKSVKGRPKTDRLDCQWLRRLHACGLLTRSFQPALSWRQVREVWRQRERVVAHGAQLAQRVQKLLLEMNLQLPTVISDVMGVSGRRMLRAIVAGEREPTRLAQLADGRIKASQAELAAALTGQYQPLLLGALAQLLKQYEQYEQDLAAWDHLLAGALAALPKVAVWDAAQEAGRSAKRPSPHAPQCDVERLVYELSGVHLTAVPGFGATDALALLLELGGNVDAWPTAKHFTSWLKLSPNACKSGGREKGRQRTRKGKHRASHLFRRAAVALRRSQCEFGHQLRQLAHHHGLAYAITAVARHLASVVYHLLRHHEDYRAMPRAAYDEAKAARRLKRLEKDAAALGYTLATIPATTPATTPA